MTIMLRRGKRPPRHQWRQHSLTGGGRGELVGFVRSNYTSDYPADGVQGEFWYERVV